MKEYQIRLQSLDIRRRGAIKLINLFKEWADVKKEAEKIEKSNI